MAPGIISTYNPQDFITLGMVPGVYWENIMLVCIECQKEMRCIKTCHTVGLIGNETHHYPGDAFKCPSCGVEIANCSGEGYFNPDPDINASLMHP